MMEQPPEVLYEKNCSFFNFAKFTGKHPCGVSFLIKLQASGFFAEHLRVTASVYY